MELAKIIIPLIISIFMARFIHHFRKLIPYSIESIDTNGMI